MTQPSTWTQTTINGVDYLIISLSQLRVPLEWDPSSTMFLAVAPPDAGMGSIPLLAKGDPGVTPTIDLPVNLTALASTDPTADSASFTLIGTNQYQLNLTLHKGPPGVNGTSTLDPTVYGTPVAGQMLIVNPTANGFVYQTPKVGDRWIPAVLNSMPAGNPAYTLGTVSVPAQPSDWRPTSFGQTVFTPSAGDTAYDLLVRLNDPVAGNIVARGVGVAGLTPPLPPTGLQAGPPAGSADSYDRVLAGNAATLYLRGERQAGTGTATTVATQTTFSVRVSPVP